MAALFLFSAGAGAEVWRLNSQQSGQGGGWGIGLQELTCQGRGEEEIPSEAVCTHRHKHMYAEYSLGMRFESGQGCDPAALCNSSSPAVGCCQSVGHPCATALPSATTCRGAWLALCH